MTDRTDNIHMHGSFGVTGDHRRKPENRVRHHKLRDRVNPQNHSLTFDPSLVSSSLNGSRPRPTGDTYRVV